MSTSNHNLFQAKIKIKIFIYKTLTAIKMLFHFSVQFSLQFQAKKASSEPVGKPLFVDILSKSKPADTIKKLFLSHFDHGPALLEHFLRENNLLGATKIKDVQVAHEQLAEILVEVCFKQKYYIWWQSRSIGHSKRLTIDKSGFEFQRWILDWYFSHFKVFFQMQVFVIQIVWNEWK